jgi:hypothetical protein
VSLPNYFLADMPADTALRPALITEACETLRRNRARYLLGRSTESIVQTVTELARQWLAPHSPWRNHALEEGPPVIGFSRETLAHGLDGYFRSLTTRSLNALVVQDLGHPQRLDRLIANDAESMVGMTALARGPELLVHFTSGILPTPVFTSIIHGLLVRAAQFVKCPPGASLLPRLFAHCLRDVEPKLAACLEVAEWEGGDHPAEPALLAETDCVVVSGDERAVEAIRRSVSPRVRLLARGERVSAGYIAREVLGPSEERAVVEAAGMDVTTWDQLGNLSPHVLFVETGGMLPPEGFAARLAEELARVETRLPRGRICPATANAINQRREVYRIRAAADGQTRCWFSADPTAWTVVYEADPGFQESCLHRFIYVKAVDTAEECLRRAEMVRGRWSTLGLAAMGPRLGELAQRFADWGVTRICPLGRMQYPPLTWRQDGRPTLGDLVGWSHHEWPPEA